MNIQEILNDWNDGLTHDQILAKHNIAKEIEVRIKAIKPGMKSAEILSIMRMLNE